MNDDSNDRLHERLAALRRVTVKRGATKAEAETAKRLAGRLAKRLGKKSNRQRRRGSKAVLPEPTWARRRRLWQAWLEAALEMIDGAIMSLHGLWVATLAILVVMLAFGDDELRRQVGDLYLFRWLFVLGAAFLLMISAAVLAVAAWWLRTLPGERFRAAVLWAAGMLPFGLIAITWIIATVTLDAVMGKGLMSALCSSAISLPITALGFAWYHWGHPVLQRKLGSICCGPH